MQKNLKENCLESLQQCVDIAFKRNNQPENNSAYCPKSKESIYADFEFMINNPNSLVVGLFSNDVLLGVLGCFTNPDNNWVDCIGPFFANDWDQDNAKAMFAFAKSKLTKAVQFNFYFDARNKNLHQLMDALSAKRKDNEYVLMLEKCDYKPQQLMQNIVMYSDKFENDVIKLHDATHIGLYVTGKDIVNSVGKDREVFCALDENGLFVGYGVLKRYDNTGHMTAEIFAVAKAARGNGYGWALLNTVVDCALNKHNANTIDLVVDKLNTHASNLYYSCGFKLVVENSSYFN